MPEVSLVAILDADKEGFLRSHRSLTQTVGRAARNLNGAVIMYADKITDSMQLTIDETNRRRSLQLAYNEKHGITPKAIVKARNALIGFEADEANMTPVSTKGHQSMPQSIPYADEYRSTSANIAADPVLPYMSDKDLQAHIEKQRAAMRKAAKNMEFIEAARLRDEIIKLEEMLAESVNN